MWLPSVVVALAAVACGTGAVAIVLGWLSTTIRRHQHAATPWLAPVTTYHPTTGAITRFRYWLDRGFMIGGCCASGAVALLLLGGDQKLAPVAVALAVIGMAAVVGKLGVALTEVRRRLGRLAVEEARFRSLVLESQDMIMLLDQDLVVRWQSPAAARRLGLADRDVLGRPFPALTHPLDSRRVTARLIEALAEAPATMSLSQPSEPAPLAARLRDGSGQWRETETTIDDQRAVPVIGALVLHVREIGDRSKTHNPHQRAWTDQLTGLANRKKLLHAVAELRAGGGRHGALLVIQLAGLPASHEGHLADREEVLVAAARRLRATTGTDDIVARLGGEQFCVLVDAPAVTAYAIATRIARVLSEEYPLATDSSQARHRVPESEPGTGRSVARPSVSVGVATLQGTGDGEELLRKADFARRRAIQIGSGQVESFDESIETALVRRMAIEQALPGAAERGELDLVYQVVLELGSLQPVGVEALLRWRHPTLGNVSPHELLSAAEQVGAMEHIGEWVLNGACRQVARWRDGGWNLWLSINISPYQLRWDGLPSALETALETYQLPPDQLVLELSEQGVSQSESALSAQLSQLRAVGVRLAIDNFGNCQGSLTNLRRLPVDVIKPDRALFTRPTAGERPKIPILEAIVEMARRFSLEVIATGLETTDQVNAAVAAGCHLGQGRQLVAPEHAERVEAFLESHRAPLF